VLRERELDKAAETLRADRDRAIRRAYGDGMAMRDIAAVLEITHQRVSQIVRSYEQ
jgi:DNA-directed RNA polymerase specialized sigma subunit